MPWNNLSEKGPLTIIKVQILTFPSLKATHESAFFHRKVSLYISCVVLSVI